MVAALLGTTPRLKPRSSANDLAPPLCMGLVSLRHARARSARNKSQCCGGLTTAGPEPDLYRRLPRPSSHGTLLHFSLQSSRLNICYYHQDLHLRRLHPGSPPRLPCSPQWPSYSPWLVVREANIAAAVRYRPDAPAPSIFRAS